MNIGIFTDTYLPQISGVATSIKTLTDELQKQGHIVYIFTTTDPLVKDPENEPDNIIRFRSFPFISMPERRISMAGLGAALKIVREYHLDIIHTQTEFGIGILGKLVANQLRIPVIHTLHTKYEDYLHYIANGHLIRPGAVKYIVRTFLLGTEGVICPSEMTLETAEGYGIKCPLRVIPTGIEIERFTRPDISAKDIENFRKKLNIRPDEMMLLSLARLSFEKNIQAIIRALPTVVKQLPTHLVIVGQGPYQEDLEALVEEFSLQDYVSFVGKVSNDKAVYYYKAADFFISASTSETQGLTFSEAIASGTPVIAVENSYLKQLIDAPQFGRLFSSDSDIAATILDLSHNQAKVDPLIAEKKCYEISSVAFGKKVIEFYQYMIDSYKPFTTRATENLLESSERIVLRVQKTPSAIAKFVKKYGKIKKANNKEKDN